jgi:hypothetical protein
MSLYSTVKIEQLYSTFKWSYLGSLQLYKWCGLIFSSRQRTAINRDTALKQAWTLTLNNFYWL